MKKTLLIIGLFIGLVNVNAQSDATLNETIEWLETYGEQLLKNEFTKPIYENVVFSIDTENLIQTYIYNDTHESRSIRHSLKLESVIKIILRKTDESNYLVSFQHIKEGKTQWLPLFFKNKTDATRFYNAIKHLYSFYSDYNPSWDNILELENKF